LFAGVLLLPPLGFILLVVIPHLIDWLKARMENSEHLHAWYIQPFNIAKHIIAGSAAQWVYAGSKLYPMPFFTTSLIVPIMATMITYLLIDQLLLGQVLVLARNISWSESGVLAFENLLPEIVMFCMGASVAMLWAEDAWMILPSLAPLVLMYRALMIPKLKEEAQIDSKTGLYNARYFTTLFTNEIERAKRFDRPLAFIMADLDLLRNINNTYGHLAGDAVLAGIGRIIHETIRKYDIAGRFGGEEFAIVVPEAEALEAYVLAERIRQAVEAAAFEVATSPTPIRVTMSLGVAYFPQDANTQTDLVHEADVAVYQAKLLGRNRVTSASSVPASMRLEHVAAQDSQATSYPVAFARSPVNSNTMSIAASMQPVINNQYGGSSPDGLTASEDNRSQGLESGTECSAVVPTISIRKTISPSPR
jgi:diguanylate cyclase (GGDEF)-like protein